MSTLEQIKKWQAQGLKIGFTNGVFDILHRGHVTYLNASADLVDKLVVGVNDDDSVRRLNKGPERPINDQDSRAFILSNLKSVDAVFIFGEDTPYKLIEEVQPDVLIKGGDYDPNETNAESKTYIVGSDIVKAKGGEVVSIDLVAGFSTTGIVKKMKSSNG